MKYPGALKTVASRRLSPPVKTPTFLATAPIGALLLVPSLLFLFAVFKGRNPEANP